MTNNFTFISKFFGVIADFFIEPSPSFQKEFIESFMQLYSTALEKTGCPSITIKKMGKDLVLKHGTINLVDSEDGIRRTVNNIIGDSEVMCDLYAVKYENESIRLEYFNRNDPYPCDIVFTIGKEGE